eukprot:CAMPEP_0172386472 /NCGR_PEP_ID=MMETSP1061-20121228/4009_1 /TAXON_ID=37318 /ORGANISM="Pseudo-nitzschia pungens, Strain cf. pungens" /LENGTH=236 /DNA_ID=CAMNT_0013115857 /DNA_START=404 /DNA_END=1114 /DNA_ORIENTATION=+
MAKSKSAKKKNHVSKHILKARDDSATIEAAADGKSPAPPAKKKKGKANSHIKHPDEASSYLTQWKASKSEDSSVRASSSWKFNKNTQSWLIRHMYEAEKVPKATFVLLLEYLEGLEGKTIKDRMRSDASRRCRRHKEYCKNNPEGSDKGGQTEKESQMKNKDGEGDGDGDGDDDGDEQTESKTTTTAPGTSAVTSEELECDEALWKKLDDHEKRKQYKRARKILDLVKNSNKEDSD